MMWSKILWDMIFGAFSGFSKDPSMKAKTRNRESENENGEGGKGNFKNGESLKVGIVKTENL